MIWGDGVVPQKVQLAHNLNPINATIPTSHPYLINPNQSGLNFANLPLQNELQS